MPKHIIIYDMGRSARKRLAEVGEKCGVPASFSAGTDEKGEACLIARMPWDDVPVFALEEGKRCGFERGFNLLLSKPAGVGLNGCNWAQFACPNRRSAPVRQAIPAAAPAAAPTAAHAATRGTAPDVSPSAISSVPSIAASTRNAAPAAGWPAAGAAAPAAATPVPVGPNAAQRRKAGVDHKDVRGSECPARFVVTRLPDGFAEIRYIEPQHNDQCLRKQRKGALYLSALALKRLREVISDNVRPTKFKVLIKEGRRRSATAISRPLT